MTARNPDENGWVQFAAAWIQAMNYSSFALFDIQISKI